MTDRPTFAPIRQDEHVTLYHGDCVEVMRSMADGSIDAVICDPPYAIRSVGDVLGGFRTENGAGDSAGLARGAAVTCRLCGAAAAAAGYAACKGCLNGVEADAYASADMLGQQSANWNERATHSRGYADNDPAQFQRWCALWACECLRVLKPGGHLLAFGGTRTWHRVAVALEDAGFEIRDSLAWLYATGFPKSVPVHDVVARYARDNAGPSDVAYPGVDEWAGWGTALKPAHEPIVMARKPLAGTVAANVLEHGTGALDIDTNRTSEGRWPANVLLDETRASELDATGEGASRFFYVAKPTVGERVRVGGVTHPTVKPLALMQRLVRLVTPEGATVLDPFAGSGSTVEACLLEGRLCVAVEKDPEYIPLIERRIQRQLDPLRQVEDTTPGSAAAMTLF